MQILSHISEYLTAEEANSQFPTAFVRTDVFVHTGTAIVNIEDVLKTKKTYNGFLHYLCPAIDYLVAKHLNLPVTDYPNHDTSVLYKDIFTALNLPTPDDDAPLDEIISDNEQYKQFFLNNNIAKHYQDTQYIDLNRLDLLNYLLSIGKTTLNFQFLFFSNK